MILNLDILLIIPQLAEALLQKETLNYDDVKAVLGPMPYQNKVAVEPLQFESEINTWREAGKQG